MFFVLSKVAGWLATPLNALIALQALGVVLLWTRRRRLGAWLCTSAALLFLAVGFTPLADLALHPLEQRYARPEQLPQSVQGIILIGSAQNTQLTEAYGTAHMGGDAQTMTEFAALARHYPHARRVFSGGSGRLFPGKTTEARVVQLFFQEQGLDPASLVLEERSRTTYENALLSHALVRPKKGESWLLVTAAFHMPRSIAVFHKAGWSVIAWPVAYRTLPHLGWDSVDTPTVQFEKLQLALHEWIGLAAYRITGRS